MPNKRAPIAAARYLEPEDVKHLLAQPDVATPAGQRDHALILFLYNTGARVSEALGVRVGDLSLSPPRHVRLRGKGGKERLCPLWRETATALARLPAVADGPPGAHLFCGRTGDGLTRDGVAYLLAKYAKLASRSSCAFRQRRLTPHSLRHSCAVALLQSGVDITVIRDYLGHASIATTSRYVATNLKMKRDALDRFWRQSGLAATRPSRWRPAPDVLAFLSSV